MCYARSAEDTTSLDTLESSVLPPPSPENAPNALLARLNSYPFQHTAWKATRERVRAALADAGATKSRLDNWDNCCRKFWLQRNLHQQDTYRLVAQGCHDRMCRPCQARRTAFVVHNLQSHLGPQFYRLLTLTLRSNDAPLRLQLQRLVSFFKKLRQVGEWRSRVTGGAAFIELTKNPKTNQWHPHLHLIAEGKYFPKELLSRIWQDITGDSYVVDVRLVREQKQACAYVAKYATKAIPHQFTHNPSDLVEIVQALHHTKLIITFGTWHKWRLTETPKDPDWETIGPADRLLWHLFANDPYSERLYNALSQTTGHLHGCEFHDPSP